MCEETKIKNFEVVLITCLNEIADKIDELSTELYKIRIGDKSL